ncbi:hypothetical protein GOV09_05380 [Candidatus Woesearchaeota archaeon]|nr:hypothetical protein [Candidatus Woesearchaeota archaeon]
MRILVVHFGQEKIADYVAKRLDADLDEVIDANDYKGFKYFLMSLLKKPTLITHNNKPENYDMTVIVTPAHFNAIPPAVRTYLNTNIITKSAFILVGKSRAIRHAFAEMLSLIINTKLIADLFYTKKNLFLKEELDDFIEKVKQAG